MALVGERFGNPLSMGSGEQVVAKMGPVLIFDKSTLQSLSVDESVWLENFFHSNITPMFFVETLADLSKPRTPRGAESLVANLARKTPTLGAFPNGFHLTLAGNDLLGNHPPMSNQVVLLGGESKRSPDGRIGTHYDEFDETEAFARWQRGEFQEIERALAGAWRATVTNIDFRSIMSMALRALDIERVADLVEARHRAAKYVATSGRHVVESACRLLGVSEEGIEQVTQRYDRSEHLPLVEFAPYASHIVKVTLFFYVSMASHLIARERPSNMIDIAYLYYLPFCQAFASHDKLHGRTVPLFCEQQQLFVNGRDLKAALREIDRFYQRHEEEIERVGIMRFAPVPPQHLDNVVTQLWDRFMRGWREREPASGGPESEGSKDQMTPERLVEVAEKSTPVPSTKDSDYVFIKRKAHIRKGRWRIMPPEVEER